jgi:DNA polymerase-3 subunit alpha
VRGQSSLFGLLEVGAIAAHPPRVDGWPLTERLSAEKELLGFYVTGHPLDPFRYILETYSSPIPSASPSRPQHHRLGASLAVQQGSPGNREAYALLTLEDLAGSVNSA